jgi:surface antigen
MIRKSLRCIVISSLYFFLAFPVTTPLTYADPPPHAPAHGWRKKHDPYYLGYTGKHWEKDYGVYSGRCNREAVGAVIGGVIGGVVGNRAGGEEHKAIATIAGVVIGAVIGAKIGREMDEGDRACMGHALELAKNGQSVSWINNGVNYRVTPLRDRVVDGRPCREFETRLSVDGQNTTTRSTACRQDGNIWQIGEPAGKTAGQAK